MGIELSTATPINFTLFLEISMCANLQYLLELQFLLHASLK